MIKPKTKTMIGYHDFKAAEEDWLIAATCINIHFDWV